MAFSLAASVNTGNGGTTTAAINTTGAKLITIVIADTAGTAPTDSLGNTWTMGPSATHAGSSMTLRLWYCINPTTGASHTFTAPGASPAIGVQAWNAASTPALDQQSAGNSAKQAGSITPTANGT